MSSSPTINFGIAGTGAIAQNHAEAIVQVSGAELRAVFNRHEEKARRFAAGFSVQWESTLSDLLQRSDIDVVCVTTPSGNHAEIAIPAMEAGKHVFCEKPLEVTAALTDRMLEAAELNNRILAAVFQSRMSQQARLLKAAIDARRFGRMAICSAYIKWWRTQEYYDGADWRGTWSLDGGGALMNQSIHYVDLLQWLVGMPESVFAQISTRAHDRLEVEDVACVTMKFPNGALGVMEASTACFPGYERRIEISGDAGSAVLEDNRLVRWDFAESQPGDEDVLKDSEGPKLGGGSSDPRSITSDGHRLQVEDLVRAINEGTEPAIPGRAGRNAIHLIESIYSSARSGQSVRM